MIEKLTGKPFKGFKVQKVNALLMIVGCLLTLLVFISTFRIKAKYQTLVLTTNDYSECNKAVNDFCDASDYLTDNVRLFTVNLKPEYMDNYFFELQNIQRRELSLEILEMSHLSDAADINLKRALDESNKLVEKEMYSIKLICEACKFNNLIIPEDIDNISLTEEDKNLSKNEKIEKARKIVFDKSYVTSKDTINLYINGASTYLINNQIIEKRTGDYEITQQFVIQIVLIIVLFIVCISLYITLVVFVLVPLFNNLVSIQKGVKMSLKGGYEVRYIASAYNALCDKNAVTASILKHKAEHDPLTGLINREAFGQIKDALKDSGEPIAYLIIDIDLFKQVNDKFGHPTGDAVLKKISTLLMEQFRNSDYVARVGGDEFAVIMTKFGSTPTEIIQRKIESLNKTLQSIEDGLPSVSLSVGVAFSEAGYNDDLVKYADQALYKVKRGGRCNCSFYNDGNSND